MVVASAVSSPTCGATLAVVVAGCVPSERAGGGVVVVAVLVAVVAEVVVGCAASGCATAALTPDSATEAAMATMPSDRTLARRHVGRSPDRAGDLWFKS